MFTIFTSLLIAELARVFDHSLTRSSVCHFIVADCSNCTICLLLQLLYEPPRNILVCTSCVDCTCPTPTTSGPTLTPHHCNHKHLGVVYGGTHRSTRVLACLHARGRTRRAHESESARDVSPLRGLVAAPTSPTLVRRRIHLSTYLYIHILCTCIWHRRRRLRDTGDSCACSFLYSCAPPAVEHTRA